MIRMSEQLGELAAALAKAQAKVTIAKKDSKNPHLNTRYADLGSAWDACRSQLAENGLAVAQLPVAMADGKPGLATMLMHQSGQFVAADMPLDVREQKGITVMQALGSAITYARRYSLMAAVGLVADDDDGNGAGGNAGKQEPNGKKAGGEKKDAAGDNSNGSANGNGSTNGGDKKPLVNKKQVEEIMGLCIRKGVKVDQLHKRFNIDSLNKMTLSQYGITKSGLAGKPDVDQGGNDDDPSDGVEV